MARAPKEEPKVDETAKAPEVELEDTVEMKRAPQGPQVSGDGNFTLNLLPNGSVEISPRPWEGPAALTTRPERVAELIDALKQYDI